MIFGIPISVFCRLSFEQKSLLVKNKTSQELLEILNEIHSERAFQKINKKGETS